MKGLVSTVNVSYSMLIIDLKIALANYFHFSLMFEHSPNIYNQLQVRRKIFES